MKRAILVILLFAFGSVLPFQTANAMPNVNLDYTKTTITLHETVNFTAQASYSANITWFCDDVNVQSNFGTASNYTFVPKAVGVYYIKLSVNGFTNPPPTGPTKVTVIGEQTTSPTPTPNPAPIPYPVPTPYSTYHKGDPYTTVYSPSEITAPNGTEPTKITIISPINQTLISTNNFTVTFDLILEGSNPITLQSLTYKTSWQSDNVPINFDSKKKYNNETLTFSISLSNVPEGEQSIAIIADTMSEFETGRESKTEPVSGMPGIPPYGNYYYIYSNYYLLSGLSSLNFTINTIPTITPSPMSGNLTPNLEVEAIRVAAVVLLVLVIAIFLLIYGRHRKTANLSK